MWVQLVPEFHGAMLICNAFTDRKRAVVREKINSSAKHGHANLFIAVVHVFFGICGIYHRVSNLVRLHLLRLNISDCAAEIATFPRDYSRLWNRSSIAFGNIERFVKFMQMYQNVFSDESVDDFHI